MAVTKIKPIKSTLRTCLRYICNPDKTDGELLISTFGCAAETADIEFHHTISQARNKGNNLAHHLIQSFEPGEVSPEMAHKIGKRLAEEVTGGKYEYVLTTHIDKGHVHNHLVFCSVDFLEHKKYVSNKKSLYGIRNASDRLCKEYGLGIVVPNHKGKSYVERDAEKKGGSWKDQLRQAIDHYIPLAADFEDLLRRMEADSFAVKRAKYHSYKLPGAASKVRFIGGPTLGPEYTDDRIRERIAGLKRRSKQIRFDRDDRINLVIDLENSVKAQRSAGYAHWAKINNLKQAARTVGYLADNGIQHYSQLRERLEEVLAADRGATDAIRNLDRSVAAVGLLIKNMETYRQTKPVYTQYLSAGAGQKPFRQDHRQEILLHEAARKFLREQSQGGKLPGLKTLREEYVQLVKEKDALAADYRALKRDHKHLNLVKQNVDFILGYSSDQLEQDKTVAR